MNIGINLLFLEPGKVGGSETYARAILDEIDNKFAPTNNIFLYCSKSFADTIDYRNIIVRPLIHNSLNKIFRMLIEQLALPVYLLKDKVFLLHSMGYTSPLITSCKKIVTIFDTQYISVPYTMSWFSRLMYSLIIPLVIKSNNAVITSSQFSKIEIRNNFNCKPSKIYVIYGAASIPCNAMKIGKKDNYIMTSSATHPHKNIVNVVKSFKILISDSKYKNLKLYITGFPAKGHKELLTLISSLNLGKRIKYLGWVERGKYFDLLSKAKVFVFPSYYEGFGFPPLESMAVGTPVVVSDRASLPEIVGKSGVVIDPDSPISIANAISKLIENNTFSRKKISEGLKRSRMFSWYSAYKKTIFVYKKIAQP